MLISIVGMTLAGLAWAAALAQSGFQVLMTDMDEEMVHAVKEGELPGYEKGLAEALAQAESTGNLELTDNVRRVMKMSDVMFITCAVPEDEEGRPSARFAKAIVENMANHTEKAKTVVVKSVVPPGTAKMLEESVQTVLDNREEDYPIEIVISPDMARPGERMKTTCRPDVVVIGSKDSRAGATVKSIYQQIGIADNRIKLVTPREAEMSALVLSGMLAIKKAVVNEMGRVCQSEGANIDAVLSVVAKDSRIGSRWTTPDPGFGGSELPKDLRTIKVLAEDHKVSVPIIDSAEESNTAHLAYCLEAIGRAFGSIEGKTLAVLGISTAPGADELREAPALTLIERLAEKGAFLKIYSPEGFAQARWRFFKVKDQVDFSKTMLEAVEGVEGLVVMSRVPTLRASSIQRLKEKMKDTVMVDLVGQFTNRQDIIESFKYYRMSIQKEVD